MEIKEQQADKLTIEASVSESIGGFILSAFKFYIYLFFIVLLILSESTSVAIVVGILGILAIWFIASFFIGSEDAFRCVIEKNCQIATLTFRAPWSFWIPRIKKFPLDQIVAVIFSKDEDNEPRLSLKQKSGDLIVFGGGTTTQIVESLSSFLRIPLHILLGSERITHIPWNASDNLNLIPTPCASCGAPLPKIEADMRSVKCSHCGMNMVIHWREGELSYRAEKEF